MNEIGIAIFGTLTIVFWILCIDWLLNKYIEREKK